MEELLQARLHASEAVRLITAAEEAAAEASAGGLLYWPLALLADISFLHAQAVLTDKLPADKLQAAVQAAGAAGASTAVLSCKQHHPHAGLPSACLLHQLAGTPGAVAGPLPLTGLVAAARKAVQEKPAAAGAGGASAAAASSSSSSSGDRKRLASAAAELSRIPLPSRAAGTAPPTAANSKEQLQKSLQLFNLALGELGREAAGAAAVEAAAAGPIAGEEQEGGELTFPFLRLESFCSSAAVGKQMQQQAALLKALLDQQ